MKDEKKKAPEIIYLEHIDDGPSQCFTMSGIFRSKASEPYERPRRKKFFPNYRMGVDAKLDFFKKNGK